LMLVNHRKRMVNAAPAFDQKFFHFATPIRENLRI